MEHQRQTGDTTHTDTWEKATLRSSCTSLVNFNCRLIQQHHRENGGSRVAAANSIERLHFMLTYKTVFDGHYTNKYKQSGILQNNIMLIHKKTNDHLICHKYIARAVYIATRYCSRWC